MDVKDFKAFTKEIRKMVKLADKIGGLLEGANVFNAKGRLDELVPLFQQLLPRVGSMKTTLEQYGPAFTEIMDENAALKKANEKLVVDSKRDRQKSLDSESALHQLQSEYRKLEQKLAAIPPEVVAQYTRKGLSHDHNR